MVKLIRNRNMIVLINKSQEYKKHSHPRSDEIYHLIKGKIKVLEIKKKKIILKNMQEQYLYLLMIYIILVNLKKKLKYLDQLITIITYLRII